MHQSHKSSKIKIRGLGSIEMNFENEIFFLSEIKYVQHKYAWNKRNIIL